MARAPKVDAFENVPHIFTSSHSNPYVQGIWRTWERMNVPHVTLTFWVAHTPFPKWREGSKQKMWGRREGERMFLTCPEPFVHRHLRPVMWTSEGYFDRSFSKWAISLLLCKKLTQNFVVSKIISIFAADSGSSQGWAGQYFVVKGRLRTLSSVCESRKFQSTRRERNRNVHIGCIALCLSHIGSLNISRRGLSSCLSLYEAMREPTHGIGEVEHPRLSV